VACRRAATSKRLAVAGSKQEAKPLRPKRPRASGQAALQVYAGCGWTWTHRLGCCLVPAAWRLALAPGRWRATAGVLSCWGSRAAERRRRRRKVALCRPNGPAGQPTRWAEHVKILWKASVGPSRVYSCIFNISEYIYNIYMYIYNFFC
jgi:hypothetical protein